MATRKRTDSARDPWNTGHFVRMPIRIPPAAECEGHPAGPFDPMGETVYCDGSCRRVNVRK